LSGNWQHSRMAKPSLPAIEAFLAATHGAAVTAVEPLPGGFWSSAFGYVFEGRDLVLRLGSIREGFEADRAAMAYSNADLPVPIVLEIGDAFGESYAISARHRGAFLEDLDPVLADVGGPTLLRLLTALFSAPDRPAEVAPHWRTWLLDALLDDPARRVSGWRNKLRQEPGLERLFAACEQRIAALVDACPERRDLVHGDLLHTNVLMAPDATRITAVFSWKCSLRGDFLYDTAWCTFWGESFHPGIAAADVWRRITTEPAVVRAPGALTDAAIRHHCYELQIGASHLAWNTWVGNDEDRRRVAQHTTMLLERGPKEPLPTLT
jgi:aminoglycoside phosphotransferase (APT) family kinase protein